MNSKEKVGMMAEVVLTPADVLEQRVHAALLDAGADAPSADAATRAMMHASRLGVDSHGVRLTPHYARVLRGGRVNGRPDMTVRETSPVSFALDADNGLGHLAAYKAVDVATDAACRMGIAAVGVHRSSHFGPAGAYAMAGQEKGCITICVANSDSIVALFNGAERFHGTNPLAIGIPVPGEKPWLLDMATSSVPMNRVLLYRVLGIQLPEGVAADLSGTPTRHAPEAEMLMPLGGADFGFKGAALAGFIAIMSSVVSGAVADPFLPEMAGDEVSTPRNIGHFLIAIHPSFFGGAASYEASIKAYLAALRGARARDGGVMAPGDREWLVEIERARDGIPVDPETAAFLGLA